MFLVPAYFSVEQKPERMQYLMNSQNALTIQSSEFLLHSQQKRNKLEKESFRFLVKSFSGCLENIQDTLHSCSKDSSIFRLIILILSNILQTSLQFGVGTPNYKDLFSCLSSAF